MPGPALVFSFILLGGACALAALCYAELASMIPQAGSAYAYSYATLGELVAWIIGWDLILEYAVGNVAVAISWGDYFKTLLRGIGMTLPAWLTTGYRTALLSSDPAVHGLLETAPRIAGMPILDQRAGVRHRDADHLAAAARRARERHARTTSWWSSSCWRSALFIAVGVTHLDTANYHAVRAERLHRHPPGRGDRVLCLHRVRRDLDGRGGNDATRSATCRSASSAAWPSAPSSTSIVGAVLTGMVPYTELAVADPLAHALELAGFKAVGWIVALGAVGVDVGGAARVPVRAAAHLLRDGARRPACRSGPPR